MNHRSRSFCLANLICLLLTLALGNAPAQQRFDVRANYTKREVQIPMRDGVKLFTSVYVPKPSPPAPLPMGEGGRGEGVKYPIMLLRTPYSVGPYGPDSYRGGLGPSLKFAQEGYIFAYQDVRGRWMSEGEFMDVRPHKPVKSTPRDVDENSDTYDTIEWLLKNTPNNGRVGMWGVSYPGFYTSMGLMDTHPALKAASPQAPVGDWFLGDDWHHHGAFLLTDAFGFYSIIAQPRPGPTTQGPPRFDFKMPDQYKYFLEMGPLRNANEKHFNNKLAFWNELMQHPNYDSFWKERTPLPHLKSVKCAVMTVGGWFDAEDLYGTLKTYQAIERQNPGIHNTLVMGPWTHGGWGGDGAGLADISFGDRTGAWYRDSVEFPFFNYYLKDKGTLDQPEALAFETGVNTWQKFDAWPPRNLQTKSLYFSGGGNLSFEPPKPESTHAFDEYVSDPAKPVPYTPTIQSSARHVDEYMIEDQRFAATRPDVLVYRSDELREDLKIAGPVTANLRVSTTGTDADFIVKLIDVFPDDMPDNNPNPRNVRMGGYQMLVRAEVMRARFRDSYERPRAMRPGRVTPVKFALPDVCHAFKKGHRVMVHVQSSWFPLVDRNPQKFVDIYSATEADFQKATHRVYFSAKYPSRIEVGVRE